MKKKIYLFLLLFLSLSFVGCGKKYSVTEISFEELEEKMEAKENFILMIGAQSCPHCDDFKKTLKDIFKKYDVIIYYIDVDQLSSEEKKELKSHFPYSGTPTTVNVVEGKEKNSQSRIDGALDYGTIKKRLITWGYIKEES